MRIRCRTSLGLRAGVSILVIGLTACLNEGLPGSPTSTLTQVSVTGTVRDSAQAPVDTAFMQLTTQAGASDTAFSDAQGRYSLSGSTVVSGSVTVRATKAGLGTAIQTRQVTAAGGAIQIDLTLIPPTPPPQPIFDLTGEHTLTLVADDACAALPSIARSRTYLATVTPTSFSSSFDIRLSGASFFPDYDRMSANVEGTGRINVFAPSDGADLPVTEALDDGSYVEFIGTATPIAGWSNEISARFDGIVSFCPAGAGSSVRNLFVCNARVQCPSETHHLTLTRR